MTPQEALELLRPEDPLFARLNTKTSLVRTTRIHSFTHMCGEKLDDKDVLTLHRAYASGPACAYCRKCNTLFASTEMGDPVEPFRRK